MMRGSNFVTSRCNRRYTPRLFDPQAISVAHKGCHQMSDYDVIDTFISRFAGRFRFDPKHKAWFRFVDGQWAPDDTLAVEHTARLLARELREQCGNPKRMASFRYVRMIVNQAKNAPQMRGSVR
jgi:hypothetical protein